MTIVLYGIPNCDTVKKARLWLAERGIDHEFHDYKKQGADPERIAGWIAQAGLARVLNKAGTTYKRLPDAVKVEMEGDKATEVMAAQPSTIKRPIVEYPGGLLVGFKPEEWEAAFASQSSASPC
ncbi:arsenate reductase [Sphingomonas desiccabilis]|uniref:Arsenate reductase n=1 Tax=Sphingomonas desiccabilis TaxID=429134 RepID=A0A4V1QP54_9SPHN|nr:arsenate reductase [Sphingomonas desiccabilis]MBB3911231.1 Spx/MgsR family transcriptional regulator [Sphingomonas desiccabilis]RXZ31974.1 arsenate reductase [Sphingomonas desiccabilis]